MATFPWDVVGHAHWQKVQWIPFRSPPVKLRDVLINLALYFPFGYAVVRALAQHARRWHAVALACALSIAIEWSQLYSHSRFPSVQDVLCDIAGAWGGAWLATRLRGEPPTNRSTA